MTNSTEQRVHRTLIYLLHNIRHDIHAPNWQQDDQRHQAPSLLFITGGSGQLSIDGMSYNLGCGKSYFMAAGTTSRLAAFEDGLKLYWLSFEPWTYEGDHFVPCSSSHGGLPSPGELICSPFSQCIAYLESITLHRSTNHELGAFYQHEQFQALMRMVLEQNATLPDERSVHEAVKHSIEHMKQHYQAQWTVDQLADWAKVARWHYTPLFKEITGQVPLDYLNEIRIERSKQLLRSTHDRLYDIAHHVGFNNEYYFSRRFKQTVGISPGRYRRNHQDSVRVFAPFFEDFLVALGITPVVQCTHDKWGTQDYLGLQDVPTMNLAAEDVGALSHHKPEFIMIGDDFERWRLLTQLEGLAPLYMVSHLAENWRLTLHTTADLLGKPEHVQDIIAQYERKAHAAQKMLRRSVRGQTVACLRITARRIFLYAGPEQGFTGPILYKDLGLTPHPLVLRLAHHMRRIELAPEWLARLDADHLFITFDKSESVVDGEERGVLHSSAWLALPAVQNQCVYEVDFLTWMNYGVISNNKKIDDVLNVLA
ncbi:helix-turn-helix domain-containing protein [Paenibacillus guangzhouensis]|uniref:helix-turn-helix domain-containing protein n=1 Tax=Paenibacillus guangzhouensis TaxID=1473112 RepID=UPI001D115882|nr:helix-turn-helix domain-containing protein [Paenibacillus guangzhouensis]